MRSWLLLPVLLAVHPGCSGSEDHPGAIPDGLEPDAGAASGGGASTGGRSSGGREGAGGRGSGGRSSGGASSGGQSSIVEAGLPDAGDAGAEAGSEGGAGAPDGGGSGCDRGTLTGSVDVFSQADLAGLRGYTEITGNLYIGTNVRVLLTDVSSLAPLECLQRVGGLFTILESPQLVDLTGLQQLTFVSNLRISLNAGLVSLEGLGALSVEGLLVRANPALLRLSGGIVSASLVEIYDNPSLPQCEADRLAQGLSVTCSCSGNAGAGTCN